MSLGAYHLPGSSLLPVGTSDAAVGWLLRSCALGCGLS